MSTASTPNDSPIHMEALHKPSQAAHVVAPQAPLGDANNLLNAAPGTGAKALLARKMAKNSNPKYISPTDNFMTPCSQKINNVKKKHFSKGMKAMQQLQFEEKNETELETELEAEVTKEEDVIESTPIASIDDDENPF